MREERNKTNKPLIIYVDDDGSVKRTYSEYTIEGSVIIFITAQNKITLPTSRLIKIKEDPYYSEEGTI